MGKTILITGSTDGIGQLAAIKLAKEGHTICLHGRNTDKLAKVIAEVKSESNNQQVKGYVADFSDIGQIQHMADQINKELTTIDVLINNAGIFKSSNPILENGLDIRFMVNYLAPYVLTDALLPLLKSGEAPRLINLSSAAQASVTMDGLTGKQHLSDQEAYAQSKLAILQWSFYMAKQEPSIYTIALNPGSLLNTKMVQEAFGEFWSPADKGAQIIYDIAITEKYAGITGKYYDNDQGGFGKAHPDAYDEGIISEMLNETNRMLGSIRS